MATFTHFEEIDAWQKAHDLANAVYDCSDAGSFARDFSLRDQVRRAAVSVMANIAEGFERGGNAEFVQFLATARGSAAEVESHFYLAVRREYVTREQFEQVKSMAMLTRRLIAGLITYLRRSGMKGVKFKPATVRETQPEYRTKKRRRVRVRPRTANREPRTRA